MFFFIPLQKEMLEIDKLLKDKNYHVICWAIKIPFLKVRIEILQQLGFKIGYNIITDEKKQTIGSFFIGKNGKYRIQISKKLKDKNLAYCVIY